MQNDMPTYLLGDHLGSTSITTFENGNLASEMKYKAWGEVRYTSGVTTTDYTYTGQYSNTGDFGLMFYNARWYDPVLGRFAQADTIVSNKEKGVNPYLIVSYNETDFLNQLNQRNTEVLAELRGEKDKKVEPINIDSQGFDRFSYTNNNPVNFNDPTGHCLGPASVACLALIPTGPIGWAIIAGLVIVDVALVVNLVNTWDVPTTTTTETTTLDLVVTANKPDIDFINYLQRKYGLSNPERRILHDLITRQGMTEEEIEAEAAELARLKQLKEQHKENKNDGE